MTTNDVKIAPRFSIIVPLVGSTVATSSQKARVAFACGHVPMNDYVLGLHGATWEHFGGIRWELLGCLTLAWIICFLCLMRGVQSIGKVVYFTALFPYVMLTVLLIRGVTLDGASEGSLWFITPKWSTLQSPNVWADAASQVFYSLGIGCGSLITLSSYSNFNNNCHRQVCKHKEDAIFVTLTNLLTSIFAGFVIFSIMGFLSLQMGIPIEQVIQSGTGLAFIAYPEAVARMPLPNLWAVLFFVMLFILGIGSQFAGVQAINTAILDLRPDLRKHETYVVLGICVTCWLLAIPMVFDGGIYLFTLMDWNTASWAILLIGIAEVGVVGWCYGCNKFLRNIAEIAVFVYQICTYELPRYGKYIFPGWANAIGILIGLSTLAPMPFFFIRRLWKGPRDRSLFRPKKTWGPAMDKNAGNDTPSTASVKTSQPSGDKPHEDCV
ncbi:Sodium- and chloride-dependent glycine transporter 1 [Habropoda laboriosa]|uniref:Sodium-and chloride-dependent glycine transporter 1 n=1 Tax=Habropoda laboriosa TaxID=597456 RepID=A0A0L7QZK6_9HYME|nr:Sodium- and chloride-dependent glycine transporter 1 [Habropoda laboriosa]